jgi:8-oxo-dGTP pyrophosphatase MutT (NUDIX family)
MTTLGGMLKVKPASQPLDLDSLTASVVYAQRLTPTAAPSIRASLQAWTEQDEDAHEPCSLTACRAPLHPGPCKGWKHTLHAVSPSTYHQIEAERVRKANTRRLKRIADLKAQGKPIPRKLLTEIKAKPAPAHAMTAQPLSQVGQKADLAGGQAHHASQAINNAAGVKTNTAPLPLGPKQKKPSVAGRGPAFVITQPKVTDTYKLDKAQKITPQEWDDLSVADKKAIRDELEAIKVRGFGPQQTRATALLAQLRAPNTVGNTAKAIAPSNAPGTGSSPAGKVTLGKAIKVVPMHQPGQTPQLPAPPPAPARGQRDQNGILNTPHVGGPVSSTSVGLPDGYRISRDRMGYSLKHNGKLIRTSNDQAALEKYAKDHADGIAKVQAAHKANPPVVKSLPDQIKADQVKANAATPAAPSAPKPPAPAVLSPDAQQARAVAGRGVPKAQMAKTHLDVYGKLTKADFDQLDDKTQRTIRDDLANAKAKFLDPKKQQAAADLLDRFGSRHTAPVTSPAAQVKSAAKVTPTNVARMIRKDGSVDLVLGGKKVNVGFAGADRDGKLEMVPGGHYVVTMKDGTKHNLAKGQLVEAYPPSAPAAPAAKLPDGHQRTLEKIASGAKVSSIGNGHANPGLADLEKKGLVAWNPTAKQFELTDAGKAHLPKSAAHPKGYSDPVAEAVKAASSGLISTDDVIKTAGRLSPDSIKQLDDADRKQIVGRLAFVATHPKATQAQKDKAAALKRIMVDGSPALTARKWDHTPTLAELHTEEENSGVLKVAAALKAADTKHNLTPGTMRVDRMHALTALSKAQFDALTPDQQRKITDALHDVHSDGQDLSGITKLDPAVDTAFHHYTGKTPGVHRLLQAEADFRAGKITPDQFRTQLLHARVQSRGKYGDPNSPEAKLAKEAQRIAEDNPKLPIWLRAEMIENPYNGRGHTYGAVAATQNQYNFDDAPRLSSSDISQIFGASVDELKQAHPVHAEAVKKLREHILLTGLRGQPGVPTGSPWSYATRNHVVDNLLHISRSDFEVPEARLKEFNDLPPVAKMQVRSVLRERINSQTDDHAKTGTWLALRELEGNGPLPQEQRDAVLAAANRFGTPDLAVYRRLDRNDYANLPPYVQNAIDAHLDEAQKKAETASGGNEVWGPTDNPLKVMPAALKAHLNSARPDTSDRRVRAALDISHYGTKIYAPHSRVAVYADVPTAEFRKLKLLEQGKIYGDLEDIANDSKLNLTLRYRARITRDLHLDDAPGITPVQMLAILRTDPATTRQLPWPDVANALNNLPKAEYDSLEPVYRDAIDQRIASMAGDPQAQAFDAKFHPNRPAPTPAGVTPTPQASVPPHVQAALDTIYGTHASGKSHTMAHQLSTYGALRGSDFHLLNGQEQSHLLGDLSFIATTAKGPSADKAKKLIDRFTPAGTPAGQVPNQPILPPANAVPGQVRYATPLKGLEMAKDSGKSGDGWITLPNGNRVWGAHGAAGLLLMHQDPNTGEKRYLMVQRGPAISDPGKWTFPGGASDSKETPHQGAARETIEELGLKPDALKDALVHGDHTFSVPNHTWAYTTVAAQVPTMIKPNLSTAHARAETSDAKWMTLDEIRALDKSGKLHHPIAGGKLEQNVISLYPAQGQTLGQLVRPGPVTKRQNRLRLPANGRQAPNTPPNAWTAPHKESKGRNLVTDKTAIDKLRQDVKQARKAYDGKTADGRLAAIGNMQGFDDTPTVVSKKEMDRLLATGDYIEVWRGVKSAGWGSTAKKAADINEDMRSGTAYYGKGIFGNGYYLATQKSVATQYSDGTKNSVLRALIPKSAVTEHYDKMEREAHAAASPRSKAKGGSYEDGTLWDPGRWAAAKGVDGIEIQHHHTSGGGWARHVAKPGMPAFNWLNRSVLIIQEAQ